jgi:hypothetical protein
MSPPVVVESVQTLFILLLMSLSMKFNITREWPIPVAARSKAWVYGRSLTGIVGSNPA